MVSNIANFFCLCICLIVISIQGIAATVNVTFQVNMSQHTVSPNGVHMMVDYNGSTTFPLLSHSGNQIYSVTLVLETGVEMQFRYFNGADWGDEEFPFGTCAFRTNRQYTVPASDDTVGPYCFGYCNNDCSPITETTIACVGNSLTYDRSLSNPKRDCYPTQLQNLIGDNYLVENFGYGGSTILKNADTPYWIQVEFKNSLLYKADIVVVELGPNDSKSWNWNAYGSEFIKDCAAMVDTFRSVSPDSRIFLCYPAKAFSSAYSIEESVLANEIRPGINAVAKAKGVSIIDLYDATKNASSYFPDGIHPNPAGYGILAQKVKDLVTYSPGTITRNVDSLAAPSGYSYQWYLNGDTIPAVEHGTLKKIKVTQIGEYSVGVRLSSANDDRLMSDVFSVTSLASASVGEKILSGISVYPNPFEDEIVLDFENLNSGRLYVRILNPLGGILQTLEVGKESRLVISTNHLNKGVYLLELSQGDRKIVKKMVK